MLEKFYKTLQKRAQFVSTPVLMKLIKEMTIGIPKCVPVYSGAYLSFSTSALAGAGGLEGCITPKEGSPGWGRMILSPDQEISSQIREGKNIRLLLFKHIWNKICRYFIGWILEMVDYKESFNALQQTTREVLESFEDKEKRGIRIFWPGMPRPGTVAEKNATFAVVDNRITASEKVGIGRNCPSLVTGTWSVTIYSTEKKDNFIKARNYAIALTDRLNKDRHCGAVVEIISSRFADVTAIDGRLILEIITDYQYYT